MKIVGPIWTIEDLGYGRMPCYWGETGKPPGGELGEIKMRAVPGQPGMREVVEEDRDRYVALRRAEDWYDEAVES
jgi:hypothetical protein